MSHISSTLIAPHQSPFNNLHLTTYPPTAINLPSIVNNPSNYLPSNVNPSNNLPSNVNHISNVNPHVMSTPTLDSVAGRGDEFVGCWEWVEGMRNTPLVVVLLLCPYTCPCPIPYCSNPLTTMIWCWSRYKRPSIVSSPREAPPWSSWLIVSPLSSTPTKSSWWVRARWWNKATTSHWSTPGECISI